MDWLKMLCQLENVELHIAGSGRGKEFEALCRQPNVVFHGQLQQTQLARLLNSCDIGLIPFRDIELIKGVDPIKAYEYAACGLQVWSPPIEALRCNPVIGRLIADIDSARHAVRQFSAGDIRVVGKIPRWSDRLQTALDRMPFLRSD